MKISKEPELLLQAMQEYERLISRLYAVFAEKFPEYKNFWKKLSGEEIQHADWIKKLQTDISTDSAGVVVDRFPLEAIEKSSAFVKKLIQQFSDTKLPLINALSHSLHIEEALIENKFFEIFQSQNPAVQQTMNKLQNETERHLKTVRKLWLENK